MAITAPGSGPNLIRDAHTHAIAATALWKEYVAALAPVLTHDAAERAKAAAREKRATDYARGILGQRDRA